MNEYADLDDEVRPHLVNWVRDVIRRGYPYYPELEVDFWPRSLAYFRHREAFYVALVGLYSHPETASTWGLTDSEVIEFKRIRQGAADDLFSLTINDVEIKCRDGWKGILQKMIDELNAADLKVSGLVAEERNGHLSIDYNTTSTWIDVARILLLAECRSHYTCEVCGKAGEHRGVGPIWRATRCEEHRSPNPGRLIYDRKKTPRRQMSDGKWAYDPATDKLLHVSSE